MKKHSVFGQFFTALAVVVAVLAMVAPLSAILPPEGSAVEGWLFMEPEFEIKNWPVKFEDLTPQTKFQVSLDLGALDVPTENAFYDLRAGKLSSLVMARPLVPGPGLGNSLTWEALGAAAPATDLEYGERALEQLTAFIDANAAALGIDSSEFEPSPSVTVHDNRRLTQIHIDREYDRLPVRFAALTATVNSGNLLLYGVRNWGAIDVSTTPAISGYMAENIVTQYLEPHVVSAKLTPTHLEIIPQANGDDPLTVTPGEGYTYRLAWVVTVSVENDHGNYEGVVDAHSGEMLALTDLNLYLDRRTVGGIFPVSNDQLCQGAPCPGGKPDGVEQPGHPMPFADLTLADGSTVTTNSGGLADFEGSFSNDLTGPYVRMTDTCGFINEDTVCTDLDFGSGPGTDCDVPAGADSLGNTHSSRTGFYELNRLLELIRSRTPASDAPTFALVNGQIPEVTPITSNMNIPSACNAFFTPALPSINFYREGDSSSGAIRCRNTGEIAAVFDHEFGHFLDDFDGNGLSSPSEAYADVVGITRLNDSCVGRGFFKHLNPSPPNPENGFKCTGFGNTCTECTGVRDDDFFKKIGLAPSDIDWASGNHATIPGGCVAPSPVPLPAPGLQSAPCGGSVHCNSTVVGEAFVDLMFRDLPCLDAGGWTFTAGAPDTSPGNVRGGSCAGGPPTMDANTALEITTTLFYQASNNVGFWFACNPAVGGCAADSGFQQMLAADDDNGSFADGTPHHEAIFAAFDRHQIACATGAPPVINASCVNGTTVPAKVTGLTATATVNGADLDWDDTPGAVEYWVFRTEGVLECEQGKTRIAVLNAAIDGSQYQDIGNTLDGFEQWYSVWAVGTPGCYGDMSECASVVPLSGGGGANEFSIGIDQGALTFSSGDGDTYLDNCENARIDFDVANNGTLGLTNVEIVDIRPVSHPDTTILTPMPISIGALASTCGGAGAFSTFVDILPLGMNFDETLILEVDVLADEFLGTVQTGTLIVDKVESEDGIAGDAFFDFESGDQDWTRTFGAFSRTDAGAGGAPTGASGTFYQDSTSLEDSACDVMESPVVRLTPTSTLSLFNQFDIEPFIGNWYDRANVRLVDADTGAAFVIEPDGGPGTRNYNVPGGDTFGGCLNIGEAGWAGPGPAWLESTWSTAALEAGIGGPIPAGGKSVKIQVVYGTDAAASLDGFSFDQVTVTDVFSRGPDAVGPAMCTVTNLKPDAADDSATTDQGVAVVIDVLANDSAPLSESPPQTIAISNVVNGSNGSAVEAPAGMVTYTPNPGFNGVDTFTYTICDDGSPVLCDSATVTVTVERVEDACVEPGILILTDPAGDVATMVDQFDVLSLEIAQDGDPGLDNFIFTLKMASLAAPLPVNTTWPVVLTDHTGVSRYVRMATDGAGAVTFSYGTGDNPSPFADVGTPADPSSSFDADGTIRIVVPGSAYPGIDASDTLGPFLTRIRTGESPGGALTPDNMPDSLVPAGSYDVENCALNDPPVANDDGPYNVTEGDTLTVTTPGPLGIGVLANDTDPNNDSLNAVLDLTTPLGSLTLNGDGSFSYTAAACSASTPYTETFNYHANDGALDSNIATVTINVQCIGGNEPPVAQDDDFTSPEDAMLTGNVGANNGNGVDSDPNAGDVLSYAKLTDPANGTASVAANGDLTYMPGANFHGTVSFEYQVCDNASPSLCDQGLVTIVVTPVNDAPVAANDAYTTDEDTLLVVGEVAGVLANDDDVDGDALSAAVDSPPSNGALTLNADGSFSYDPDPDFSGSDSFTYKACDGEPLCDTATVLLTVTSQPDFPDAQDDAATTDQDVAVTIDVLANDSDVDGDLDAVVDAVTDGANGTVTNNGPDVTYTPDPGFAGTDVFTYSVCDSGDRCDTANVTVTVNAIGADNVPHGVQAGYTTSGSLEQAIAGLNPGDECTFRMWVGKRSDGQGLQGRWFVQLTTGGWNIQNVANGTLDAQGVQWVQYETTFTVGNFPSSPIRLRIKGEWGFESYDVVELDCGGGNLVTNGSFEGPSTSDGTWDNTAPAGWMTPNGGAGVFNPDTNQMNNFF